MYGIKWFTIKRAQILLLLTSAEQSCKETETAKPSTDCPSFTAFFDFLMFPWPLWIPKLSQVFFG